VLPGWIGSHLPRSGEPDRREPPPEVPSPGILNGGGYVLRNARLPASLVDGPAAGPPDSEGLVVADLLVADGRIAAIGHALPTDQPPVDLRGGQLWPGFVELHTHLDKGHIAPRARNPLGTVLGAAAAVAEDRTRHWSAADVERRFDFSLRCAYAHGTVAIRTHIDSYGQQAPISWPVFRRMRDLWRGRMVLQAVSLTLLDSYQGADGEALADLVAASDGILGGVTRLSGPPESQTAERIAAGLRRVLDLAAARGLDVDLHVDETDQLLPDGLRLVARAVLDSGFAGRVTCGHCCSLALRPEAARDETIRLVRDAGLAVVSLPMVNLHLQSRQPHATPRWRGVTAIHELRAAGVPVAVSSDNCRDPFHAFGDLDGLELFREAVRICHFDLDPAGWAPAVTRWPADIMRLPGQGRLAPGAPADLVAFRARRFDELLARPHADRLVLRAGRPLTAELPDYRELDDLFPTPEQPPA